MFGQVRVSVAQLTTQSALWTALTGGGPQIVARLIRQLAEGEDEASIRLLRRARECRRYLERYARLDRDERPAELVFRCLVLQLPLELATLIARLAADVAVWSVETASHRQARAILNDAWSAAGSVPRPFRGSLEELGAVFLAAHHELECHELADMAIERSLELCAVGLAR